jgi:hypothetical protein
MPGRMALAARCRGQGPCRVLARGTWCSVSRWCSGGSALMQLVQPTLQAWLGALGWGGAMRSYRVAESADRARAVGASSPSDL